MLKNSSDSYGSLSKVLHWAMAVMIIGLVVVGFYMTGLEREDPNRINIYNLHKAVGALTLLLLIIRVVWLRASPAPALPGVFSKNERFVTQSVQSLLYLLMALVPVSGYVLSTAAGYPVNFFGLFELPLLFEKNKALADFARTAHDVLGYGILAFVLLHAAGAIKHRLLDSGGEADVLKRML